MVLEEQHQVPQHVVKSQYPPIGHTYYIAVKYQHQVISRLSLRECQKLPTVHSTDGAQFPAECANCLYTLVWGAIIGLISALSHTAWLDNVPGIAVPPGSAHFHNHTMITSFYQHNQKAWTKCGQFLFYVNHFFF